MSDADNAKLVIVLEAQSQKMQNQLVQVTKQIDRFAASTEKRFEQMNAANAASFDKLGTQIKGSLGGITQLLAAVGLTSGIKQVIDYANTWEVLQNKLKAASTYSGIQARSLEDINTAASAARTPLENYLSLYSRILNVSGNLHLTELQVAQTTDLVSKAFKISGSTAAQQAGGIIQLTEALDLGHVQGRQLRSLSTDAITISQALASYFHTTVGGLKALGAAGKITSEDLIQAILAYNGKINAAFAATNVTISDAVTQIGNAFLEFVGTTGESSGAIKKLTDALSYLATNFKDIAPIVLDFLAIVGGALAANAFVGFAGAIGEAVAALGVFLSTIAVGEFSLVAFSAAMGPMALLVGAAAAAFWVLNGAGDALSKTLETLTADTWDNSKKIDMAKDSSIAFRNELGKQITTQIQAAEAALTEANAQLAAAKTKSDAARIFANVMSGIGGVMGISNGENRGDQYVDEIMGPAEQRVKDAAAAIATLKGQANALSWQNLLNKPGTKDKAPGDDLLDPTGGKGDPYTTAVASVKDRTAALVAERAAQAQVNPLIEDYGFALDKAKTTSDLLAAAQKAGITVTPQLRTAIDGLAAGYAAADAAAKQLTESQKQLNAEAMAWRDTLKGATSSFITDLINGKSAAEALGNALTSIGNQLLSMGLDTLFGGGTFGDKSTPFGLIGQALGLGGSSGGTGAGPRSLGFASGTANTGGTRGVPVGVVHGQEAVIPLPNGGRVPVALSFPSGAGGTHVTYAPTIDARGADSSAVAALARAMAQDKAEFESKVIGTIRSAKRQRKL